MSTPAPPHGLDVLRTYGTGFAGRQAELAALDRAWESGVRVFVRDQSKSSRRRRAETRSI